MKMKTYKKVLRNKDQSNYEKYGHSLTYLLLQEEKELKREKNKKNRNLKEMLVGEEIETLRGCGVCFHSCSVKIIMMMLMTLSLLHALIKPALFFLSYSLHFQTIPMNLFN